VTREQMRDHAHAWIAHWNDRDLDGILSVFAEDAVFVSPRAQEITGTARIVGRNALQAYWRAALDHVPDLRFELLDVVCDEARSTMMVHYLSHRGGAARRACEVMVFDVRGRQVYGEALYGAEVPPHPAGT
jgi:ketosteroid isomerase-like protein